MEDLAFSKTFWISIWCAAGLLEGGFILAVFWYISLTKTTNEVHDDES